MSRRLFPGRRLRQSHRSRISDPACLSHAPDMRGRDDGEVRAGRAARLLDGDSGGVIVIKQKFDTRGEFSAWLAYASYAACAADPETARETEIIKKWNSEILGGPVLLVIGFTSQLSFLVQYSSSIFFAFDAISDAARVLRSIFTLRQTHGRIAMTLLSRSMVQNSLKTRKYSPLN